VQAAVDDELLELAIAGGAARQASVTPKAGTQRDVARDHQQKNQ
jgi:hypothetical protein